MFQRSHLQIISSRISENRKFIQVVLGPRQVGKTTLVRQFLKKYEFPSHFVTADAVPSAQSVWLEQQWELARLLLNQNGVTEALLVIDEIQKIENWSEIVKKLWDEDTRSGISLKVIILGSSRLLLQHGLTESLAGRFETIPVGHWSYLEMKDAFGWGVDQFVWFGGYPGSAELISDEKRWKRYVRESLIETSISKDILMMARVDKPALMRQLFELGCLYSGQILSFTKMLGQLQDAGNTTTLAWYMTLLDAAGLLTGLQKFSPNILRKRSSSPKYQVYNNALVSAIRPEFFEEIRQKPEEWGRLVESAVGSHLLNESFQSGTELFYWRNGNDEVDFVTVSTKILGIEVKSSVTRSLSGIQAFQKEFPQSKTLVVGKDGLSWQEFLTWKAEDWAKYSEK